MLPKGKRSKLYMNQDVKVRLDQWETRSVKTGRGVRQGCCLSQILFKLVSEYLINVVHEEFRHFTVGGQVILTVECADDLALLTKEEKVTQGMINRLIDVGRCYGMEMNVGKQR